MTALPVSYPVLQVPTAIDYTSKDWNGFVTSMLAYAAQAFPDWNTTSEGDFGVILLELFAYMGDILSYYGDRISQEAYLPTATQRLSLLNIAQTLGYIPANGNPASGTVVLQTAINSPPVSIPTATQVASSFSSTGVFAPSSQPAIFETQDLVVVPGNGGSVEVEVLQGTTETMVTIGTSSGVPGMSFKIPQLGVQDGTVQVFVQTDIGSEPWTQVDFLVDAGAEDKVFSIWVDDTGAFNVQFGDNLNGLIPALNMTIWATYRIILGQAANLPAGAVQSVVSSIPGVTIAKLADGSTANTSAMTGGSDPETNDQIRANAPAAYRAQYRAVSPQDFSDLALNVPGVLMASAVGNHSTSVSLYVLGPNYSPPGPQLVDNILDYFSDKTLAGVSLSVVPPNVIPVDIGGPSNEVQLVVDAVYSQAAVVANVTAALQALLTPPIAVFGQLLNIAQIYQTIMAVAGVSYVVVPVFTREDMLQTGTATITFQNSEVSTPGNFYFNPSGGI